MTPSREAAGDRVTEQSDDLLQHLIDEYGRLIAIVVVLSGLMVALLLLIADETRRDTVAYIMYWGFQQILGLSLIILPVAVPAAVYMLSVHKVRALRNIFYYGIWIGPIAYMTYMCVTAALLNGSGFELVLGLFISAVCPGVPWFLLAHWPARWVTPYLMALFVWSIRCPQCHEANEICSRWQCSCGYTDHRHDRNVITFSCPKCQKHIGYVDCPRCETTILI